MYVYILIKREKDTAQELFTLDMSQNYETSILRERSPLPFVWQRKRKKVKKPREKKERNKEEGKYQRRLRVIVTLFGRSASKCLSSLRVQRAESLYVRMVPTIEETTTVKSS